MMALFWESGGYTNCVASLTIKNKLTLDKKKKIMYYNKKIKRY